MKHRTLCRRVTGLALLLWAAPASAASFVGREPPDFEATDALTGETFSLRDFRGRAVVLDFWATWCGPCRRELPNVKEVYERYHDEGLEIVSVSLDRSPQRFQSFVDKSGMPWYHVMEGGGWKTPLAARYGVRAIPRMLVIDRNGVCVAEGVRGRALERAVQEALGVDARARGLDPSVAGPLLAELAAARDELEQVAEPVENLLRRLKAVAREAGSVERPGPPVARRLADLRSKLEGIRHELFMLGLLDATWGIDLGDGRSGADPAPAGAARRRVTEARRAIGAMHRACEQVRAELRWTLNRIERLERDVRWGSAEGPEALRRRVGTVRDNALALAAARCEPWLEQLRSAPGTLAAWDAPLAELDATIEALRGRLAGQAAPDGASELRDVLARAAALGVPVPVGTPAQATSAALEALAQSVSERREALEELAAEAAELGAAAEGRLRDGADLEPLRQRFDGLARRMLDWQDG